MKNWQPSKLCPFSNLSSFLKWYGLEAFLVWIRHDVFSSAASKSLCEMSQLKMRSPPSPFTQSLGNSYPTMSWKQETGGEVCQQSSEITSPVSQGRSQSCKNTEHFEEIFTFHLITESDVNKDYIGSKYQHLPSHRKISSSSTRRCFSWMGEKLKTESQFKFRLGSYLLHIIVLYAPFSSKTYHNSNKIEIHSGSERF